MSDAESRELPPIVFMKGPRVTLRPILREDIPLILRYINDPEVRRFLGGGLPMMEADEEEWVSGLHKRKPNDIIFALVVGGKFIGVMGIHRIDSVNRTATTGAFIGEKEYWGKGYGSEAKLLLLKFAFDTLNLRKICSDVLAFNERSISYSLKCGYKEEGRLREHRFRDGKYWDEVRLAVFRADWLPVWEKFAKANQLEK